MKFHNRFEKNVIIYFSNNKRTKSKEIWNNCVIEKYLGR